MDKLFRIGEFVFRLCCPEEVTPPENFMKFQCTSGSPEYTYRIEVSDALPRPEGTVSARRPDLTVFCHRTDEGTFESRLIGVKGRPDPYACYREVTEDRAEIVLVRDEIKELHIDPVFTSLLALERRLVKKDSMVLHCAYMEYKGEAILFRAIGDGKDDPGKSVGKIPGKQNSKRRSRFLERWTGDGRLRDGRYAAHRKYALTKRFRSGR